MTDKIFAHTRPFRCLRNQRLAQPLIGVYVYQIRTEPQLASQHPTYKWKDDSLAARKFSVFCLG
ncbi:hypothetical protein CBM2615_B60106 [Cupriavidus taiwanensis]|nr:hypothetical protein CBM2614_B50099 [Cupriavidus taiwanensis]SOZ69773.1 hypothetical protein CBM2615_B60106 [Cupriavidus taiwanensis]SPA09862.1 hypothetical protein CBM2625_B60018 [Cupriavidus taiwanensis]